ncbi:MAG: hypothetical protein L6R38_005211 [Xanthoria sp. 2 TBL-2021]|nr:MAG: hypothetical protein L6R38_005211 [Xanthoria sp. 2 TBL-2021]
MRALNPKSMQRQYKRIQLLDSLTRSKSGQLDRKALDRVDTANMRMWAHELGLIDDEWDQDAWREAWPLGIPAFDSAEFSVAYSQGCDYGISKRVEKYEFRLKRWLEGEDRRPAKRYLDQFHHWPNYRSSHVLDVPDPLKRHQNLPYDLNHPPIDTRATHGIRIKAQ